MLMIGYLISVGYLLGREESDLHLEQAVTELGYLDTSVPVFECWSLKGKLAYLCMH